MSSFGFPEKPWADKCDHRLVRGAHEAKTEAWIHASCLSLFDGNSPTAPRMSGSSLATFATGRSGLGYSFATS